MGNGDQREGFTKDCRRRGRLSKLTGPMSTRVVRSRTFSIGDLRGSTGGGLTRVVRGILVAEAGTIGSGLLKTKCRDEPASKELCTEVWGDGQLIHVYGETTV